MLSVPAVRKNCVWGEVSSTSTLPTRPPMVRCNVSVPSVRPSATRVTVDLGATIGIEGHGAGQRAADIPGLHAAQCIAVDRTGRLPGAWKR